MKLHDMLYDAETEAGLAFIPRVILGDAIKSLKEMRKIRLGDTKPIVAYADLDLTFVQTSAHINTGAVRSVF